ncbi:glycosyltransferase domain-containing protein [Butyrivibrio sp. X503]|uniref:glycosyltransferase domain-containing protein n=1 Tax=Butyrivibrio sp. X503 TaxID=2364878 RepID=UPI001314CE9B|nr:glycosyltransferase domain-containing protein [Butyrivibrio sp. X503]
MKTDVLLWGAGAEFRKFIAEAVCLPQVFDLDHLFVVDSDEIKWGTEFRGLSIHSPKEVDGQKYKKIVISSTDYFEDIVNTIRGYKVDCSNIQSLLEFKQQAIIDYQYTKNLIITKNNNYIPTRYNNDKLVIYTAIIGDYDYLASPLFIDDGVEYVCFTDQRKLQSDIWNIEYIHTDPSCNHEEVVRKFKCLPHMFFGEYDSSIWMDASITIKSSMIEMIYKYQNSADLMLFPHYERVCIYDEAAVCIANHKSDKERIIKQINYYYNNGYQFNNGLYCGGLIVRNHNISEVKKTMEDWHSEIVKYSKRDQISLPYVIDKNRLQIDLTNLYIYDNKYFTVRKHKHN